MADQNLSSDAAGESLPPSENPQLKAALERKMPRYFQVSGGAARGTSGRRDTEKFADDLVILQECAQVVGERLEMTSIGFGIIYDGNDSIAFRYQPDSDPSDPELVGALVNRRMPMRELLQKLGDVTRNPA